MLLALLINIHSQISPRIFVTKFEMILMGYSEARGNWLMKKNLKLKICQTSFNAVYVVGWNVEQLPKLLLSFFTFYLSKYFMKDKVKTELIYNLYMSWSVCVLYKNECTYSGTVEYCTQYICVALKMLNIKCVSIRVPANRRTGQNSLMLAIYPPPNWQINCNSYIKQTANPT